MTRLRLTLSAKVKAMEQNALCPKCFKPFAGDVEYDHDTPLGLNGQDHDEKPLTPCHKECHAIKTKSDIARIAKANRQAGITGQQARRAKRARPLLPSRGFDSRFKKKLSGEVIPRPTE